MASFCGWWSGVSGGFDRGLLGQGRGLWSRLRKTRANCGEMRVHEGGFDKD